MVKKLRFSKINLVERIGALMLVTFLDDDGNMYQWAPKWADVEQVFLKQINIERYNKPDSEWLNKFADTAQKVVEGAQRVESAHKTSGSFKSYHKQKLIIGDHTYTPGFEVTLQFLDNLLGLNVEAFLVNDLVIRLRSYGADGILEYPKPQPSADEIPF